MPFILDKKNNLVSGELIPDETAAVLHDFIADIREKSPQFIPELSAWKIVSFLVQKYRITARDQTKPAKVKVKADDDDIWRDLRDIPPVL